VTEQNLTTLKAYRPRYTADEIFLGLVVTLAMHAIPAGLIGWKLVHPAAVEEPEEALVAKPVLAASLLKLGKIDPKRLPDRLKPVQNTAPKADIHASQFDPLKTHDAGAAPDNAKDSPVLNKTDKNDLFAEDGGAKPAEGHPGGVDGGTETDPSKVHAGDVYATTLQTFFNQRWNIPSVISVAEANKLCVDYQFQIDRRMRVWYIRTDPVKKSGNDLFDDSARTLLQKLQSDGTALPDPPPDVENQYRGRTVQLRLTPGDPTKCK
jgi:hypothetical protein